MVCCGGGELLLSLFMSLSSVHGRAHHGCYYGVSLLSCYRSQTARAPTSVRVYKGIYLHRQLQSLLSCVLLPKKYYYLTVDFQILSHSALSESFAKDGVQDDCET